MKVWHVWPEWNVHQSCMIPVSFCEICIHVNPCSMFCAIVTCLMVTLGTFSWRTNPARNHGQVFLLQGWRLLIRYSRTCNSTHRNMYFYQVMWSKMASPITRLNSLPTRRICHKKRISCEQSSQSKVFNSCPYCCRFLNVILRQKAIISPLAWLEITYMFVVLRVGHRTTTVNELNLACPGAVEEHKAKLAEAEGWRACPPWEMRWMRPASCIDA